MRKEAYAEKLEAKCEGKDLERLLCQTPFVCK